MSLKLTSYPQMPQGKESAEKIRDTQITEDFCHAQSHHPGVQSTVQVQKQALCCCAVRCLHSEDTA